MGEQREYVVSVCRKEERVLNICIEAENAEDAKAKAEDEAGSHLFYKTGEVEYESFDVVLKSDCHSTFEEGAGEEPCQIN